MKALKYFFSAVLVAMATTASAQFANSGSSRSFSGSSASTDDYFRVKLSYDFATPTFDTHYSYDVNTFVGLSLEFLEGKCISQNMPLFFEYGMNVTWSTLTESDDYGYSYYYSDDVTTNIIHFTIPLNIAYKFAVNEGLTIEPHVGVHTRFNALGRQSIDDESISFFDKKDMGKEYVWNRYQIGGQAGLGFSFNNFYVGWEYSWSFTELAKKMKMNTHYIGIGYNF